MDNTTQPYTAYGGEWTVAGAVEDHGTSHLSVVDSERNAVSLTTTINTSFGAKVLLESTGTVVVLAAAVYGGHMPMHAHTSRSAL